MKKLREQLEALGCSITEETESRIVASCKPEVLGLSPEGIKNVEIKIEKKGEKTTSVSVSSTVSE
jgi:hypothetical protein